jgi:hypothetical protein
MYICTSHHLDAFVELAALVHVREAADLAVGGVAVERQGRVCRQTLHNNFLKTFCCTHVGYIFYAYNITINNFPDNVDTRARLLKQNAFLELAKSDLSYIDCLHRL